MLLRGRTQPWKMDRNSSAFSATTLLDFDNATFNSTTNSVLREWWVTLEPLHWWLLLIILSTLTTVLNFLVIVTLLGETRLRNPFNLLLLNMAFSDFLVGSVCMPFSLIYEYYQYWPLNETICSFYMYFDYTAANVSVWTLVVIAVDRLWAVQWPITYHEHNKVPKALIGVLLSWLVVNATILPGFVYTRIIFGWLSEKEKSCIWEHDGMSRLASSFPTSVVNGWLPTPIVLVCYMVIVIKAHKVGNVTQPVPAGPTRQNAMNRRRHERQAFLVLTLLVVAQVALWMPWIVYLMRKHLLHYETSEVYVTVAYWLGYSLSAVNPILLIIGNRDICHAVRRVFGLPERQRVAADSRGARMTRYLAPPDPGDQGPS